MDPKELLAKARQMAGQMRADGIPDAEIDSYLQEEIQLSLEQVTSPDVNDYLRAAGMGASFGFLDEMAGAVAAVVPGGKGYAEARDEVRTNYDAANTAATGAGQAKLTASEVGGGLVGALTGGGLAAGAARALGLGANAARATGIGARALRGAKGGAIGGAVGGTGYSTGNPLAGAAAGAVGGGIAGGIIPPAARAIGGAAGLARDIVNPGRSVAREAASQLPPNAAATMARQNALAPGTALPADLTPEMTALARGLGADPASGMAAREVAADRVQALAAAKQSVAQGYDQYAGQRIPLTPEVDVVLKRHGILSSQGDVDFETAQLLRTKLREKLSETKRGSVKHELGEQKKTLDAWLRSRLPGLSDVDSRYGFLVERSKAAKKLHQEVLNSNKNYAAARAYGSDAGSIGGSLPRSSRGLVDRLLGVLEPNRGDRARAANALLMTPGAPLPVMPTGVGAQVGGLLQPGIDPSLGWAGGRMAGGLLGQ